MGRIEPRAAPETKASPADAVPKADADNQAGASPGPQQAAGETTPFFFAPCASKTRTSSTNFKLPVLNTAARAPGSLAIPHGLGAAAPGDVRSVVASGRRFRAAGEGFWASARAAPS